MAGNGWQWLAMAGNGWKNINSYKPLPLIIRCVIYQYEISDNFNLPNSSIKKHRTIPIVGRYNGYTIETDVRNGKMNGKTIVKNEDGVIIEELNLVNDSREGECLERGTDSKLVFRGMYEDDKRN